MWDVNHSYMRRDSLMYFQMYTLSLGALPVSYLRHVRHDYSPFPRRWDSKWSSECKPKSKSESGHYCSRSLFKFWSEKRHITTVSRFCFGFRLAFWWPFESHLVGNGCTDTLEDANFKTSNNWFVNHTLPKVLDNTVTATPPILITRG